MIQQRHRTTGCLNLLMYRRKKKRKLRRRKAALDLSELLAKVTELQKALIATAVP